MTKYKLNGDGRRSGSQVTLTSYMVGEGYENDGSHNVNFNGQGAEGNISVIGQQNGKCGNGCSAKSKFFFYLMSFPILHHKADEPIK